MNWQKTGFIERERKVSGSGFPRRWCSGSWRTRQEVKPAGCATGLRMSTPGLDKRFTAKAAHFRTSLLGEAVQQVITCQPTIRSYKGRGTKIQGHTEFANSIINCREAKAFYFPCESCVVCTIVSNLSCGFE